MINVWINADHLICVKADGFVDRLACEFDSIPILDHLGGFVYGTSIKNARLLVYILGKDFPEERLNLSNVVTFLAKEYKFPKEKSDTSALDFSWLTVPLYDFQKVGSQFLIETKKALLCDDVGCGKTAESLAAAAYLLRLNPELASRNQPVLIVCPAQLKEKWAREVRKFLGEEAVIIGTKYGDSTGATMHKKRLELYKTHCPYKIVNYELLLRDMTLANKYIRPIGILIADEVQYVKSHETRRHTNIYRHALNSDYFFGLSATPIEKGGVELFNLFKMIDGGLFGDRQKFKDRYIVTNYWGGIESVKNTEELQLQAQPYVLRRHKDEISNELPEVVENNFFIELMPEQLKLYKDMKKKAREAFEMCTKDFDWDSSPDDAEDKLNPLTMTHLLRKICLSTELVDPNLRRSAKLNSLLEIIESLGESKAVIFCFYRQMVEIISRFLEKHKIQHLAIHGGMKMKVEDIISKFTPESPYQVLISSDILKEGHDLIAANYIINFDIPFSSTTFVQRCGRVDRIGQAKKTVYFINMIADKTMELDVYDTIKQRMLFTKSIFSPDFVNTRITTKDIKRFLMKDND